MKEIITNTKKETTLKDGLNVFMATRCGLHHTFNEDNVLEKAPFYGVADGVGGGDLGNVASEILMQHCSNLNSPFTYDSILRHVLLSDAIVHNELAKKNARGASMLSGAWIDNNGKGFIANVGDTRIYHISFNNDEIKLKLLTKDQTYGNLNLKPPQGGKPEDPARMIGVGVIGEPQIKNIHLKNNEGLLLCTDGLYKFLSENRIKEICKQYFIKNRKLDIESIADILVNEAIDNGSYDDTTVLILILNKEFQKQLPTFKLDKNYFYILLFLYIIIFSTYIYFFINKH